MTAARRAAILPLLLCLPLLARAQSAYGPGGPFLIPSALTPEAGSVEFGAMAGYQDM